ncbi:hypothetical protein ACA910_017324 [Epithemia clementina (nom. ined.)]
MDVSFTSKQAHPHEASEFSLLHNTVSTPADVDADLTFTTDISSIEPTSVADLDNWAHSTVLDAELDALVPFFDDLNTFDTMDTNDESLHNVEPPMNLVAEPVAFVTNPAPDPSFSPAYNASASATHADADLALSLLVGHLRVDDEDNEDDENASVDLLCSVVGYDSDTNISDFNSAGTGRATHFYDSDNDTRPYAPRMFRSPTLVIVKTVPDESPSVRLLPDPIMMFPDHDTHSSLPQSQFPVAPNRLFQISPHSSLYTSCCLPQLRLSAHPRHQHLPPLTSRLHPLFLTNPTMVQPTHPVTLRPCLLKISTIYFILLLLLSRK